VGAKRNREIACKRKKANVIWVEMTRIANYSGEIGTKRVTSEVIEDKPNDMAEVKGT
jgi:hypothetical protein